MDDRQRKVLELLDKSGASLYGLLTRLTLRDDITEELMQELFVKLSSSRGLGKIDNWDAYAHRAAINLAFDWRRRQKTVPAALDSVGEVAAKNNSPLAELIRIEELEETLNAIGRLNGACREAFVMRHVQQQSYDSIAEQMGKTAHQVRALCYKALSRLRDLLGRGQSQSCGKAV